MMSRARDNHKSGASGAGEARQGPTDRSAPVRAPTLACAVTSAESEAHCLTKFLKRSALAAGLLIAALAGAAAVISAIT
jgi:hypothetical protein